MYKRKDDTFELTQMAIKKILEENPGPDWHLVKFQQFVTDNKVSYYIFTGMSHVGLIELKKTRGKNWVRAKKSPKEIEPIHVQNVLNETAKIWRAMGGKKKEVKQVVETAVNGIKVELELLKKRAEEQAKYQYMDESAVAAVKLLQQQGYTVSVKKTLTVEIDKEFVAGE